MSDAVALSVRRSEAPAAVVQPCRAKIGTRDEVTLTTLTMTRAHDEAIGGEPSTPDRPRRSFTAEYKLALLDEYERCVGDGDKGAHLRREGLLLEPPGRVAAGP